MKNRLVWASVGLLMAFASSVLSATDQDSIYSGGEERADSDGTISRARLDAELNPFGSQRQLKRRTWDTSFLQNLLGLRPGAPIKFELVEGTYASGIIRELQVQTNQVMYVSGSLSVPESGRFFFQKQTRTGVAGNYVGVVLFPGTERAYRLEPLALGMTSELVERRLDEVICTKFPRPQAVAPQLNEQALPLNPEQTPVLPPPDYQQGIISLESLPGAAAVIYLDFSGGYTRTWADGGINYARAPLSNDRIREIWCRVTQDYLPFTINVTTDLNVYQRAQPGSRQRVLITPTDTAQPGAGGVAMIGSFNWTGDLPCWVFLLSTKECAEACAHEAGHTLGLHHCGQTNGTSTKPYYYGQGSGETSWAPIMGCSYMANVTQWCKGEYLNSNNQEDELFIIACFNNRVALRRDDVGSSLVTSHYLEVYPDDSAFAEGLIERTDDTDAFQFTTGGGRVSLGAHTVTMGPNLALALSLHDADNKVLAVDNPQDSLGASLIAYLEAGTYTVCVTGAGRNNPLTNGFSSYGSLGYYSITGIVEKPRLPNRFILREHADPGTIVGTVPHAPENYDSLSYVINAGNDSKIFAIDASGLLTVAESTALDYGALANKTQSPVQLELFVDILDLEAPSHSEANRRVVVAILPEPPVISLQPKDTVAQEGETLYLTASATGAGPITYQWFKNRVMLTNAIAPNLWLDRVNRRSSGDYFVIASNLGGSVQSASAALWIVAPQTLSMPVLTSDGRFGFTCQDYKRIPLLPQDVGSFQIQSSPDLVNWVFIDTVITLKDGKLVVIDPAPPTGAPCFYRVVDRHIDR